MALMWIDIATHYAFVVVLCLHLTLHTHPMRELREDSAQLECGPWSKARPPWRCWKFLGLTEEKADDDGSFSSKAT